MKTRNNTILIVFFFFSVMCSAAECLHCVNDVKSNKQTLLQTITTPYLHAAHSLSNGEIKKCGPWSVCSLQLWDVNTGNFFLRCDVSGNNAARGRLKHKPLSYREKGFKHYLIIVALAWWLCCLTLLFTLGHQGVTIKSTIKGQPHDLSVSKGFHRDLAVSFIW